ncbi:collagen alpha-1(III) chain-like isoform X2 [Phaenicophaeus curvirostris]|uniref:collagen alpha-1(III) chain-like isoform X2 n=1 Tax=Phaenicophaeus curvirostris TaxID=33595 RepID=UPI0037F0F1DC
MFAPLRGRRSFPREPGPWQAGPPPAPAPGPPHAWKKPPRPGQRRRGRGRWCPPGPWGPRHFPGPAAFHGNEDRRWGPHDGPLPPPTWDNRDAQGPENGVSEPVPWDASPFPGPADFRGAEDWRWGPPPPPWDCGGHERGLEGGFEEPGPWGPRPFPGPANFHGNEEDRTWGPPGCPPPPWNDNQGPEDFFGEGWFPEPPLPAPDCFAMPEFTEDEQHPPWAPASLPGERGGFQDGYPAWDYRGVGGKCCRCFCCSHGELTLIHRDADLIQHLPCPQPSRGNQPPSRSSSLPGKSQPKVEEERQDCDPPQPLVSLKDDAQSGEQTAQDPAVVSTKVPEPPEPASSPPKSPAADPPAATEAVELEQAAGEMLAAGGQPRLCSALPKPCPAGKDPRSAAILAKKEEIERSYQEFSLATAVVAAMLLQKEPSLEAPMGLALRAILRQGGMHYVRELEDFIDNYDSATRTR